jgi:threonine dehydrogenase-like Zn-dependent dehydrogenase
VERGEDVKSLKKGDRVVVECIQGCGVCEQCKSANPIACHDRKEVGVMKLNGGYAEYVLVPAHFVHIVPEGMDLKMASMCEPLAVVHKAITRLQGFVGNKNQVDSLEYAVIGAGTIGYLSAQFLAFLGRKVVIYDRQPKRLTYYDNPLIRTESKSSNLWGSPVFIEATGDPDLLHELLEQSRTGATFLLLGLPYSRRDFNFESVVAYEKTIIGSVGSSSADFSAALRLLPKLDVKPLLENVVPLDRYQEAWKGFPEKKTLKTILEVSR